MTVTEIPHKASLRFHRFIINITLDLTDFACKTPNCVLSNESSWRCTYYGHDYTVNIFNARKLPYPAIVCMTFHKGKSIESLEDEFESLFGKRPDSKMNTDINWVEKFYTPHNNIDLDKLYDSLTVSGECAFVKRIYKKNGGAIKKKKPGKIKCYSAGLGDDSDDSVCGDVNPRVPKDASDEGVDATVSMDQTKFCALVLHPFPSESNFAIEIFTSGVLNVPGIPNAEYFEKIKRYVNNVLSPIMKGARYNDDAYVGDVVIDDFIF